jgi:hypothetical protein
MASASEQLAAAKAAAANQKKDITLQDKAENGEAKASAPKASASKANTATTQFKEEGKSVRSQMTDDERNIEGSKSDQVAFVCALGDPMRKQNRVEGHNTISSNVVVGYRFKLLADAKVPVAPIMQDWKQPTDYDVASTTWEDRKAGETVALNLVETAMFISQVEYAGSFTGEGTEVILSAKRSADRPDPLPILMKRGNGSIKEGMEFIADKTTDANGRGSAILKEEFKRSFGNYYKKRTTASPKEKLAGEGQKDIAAAFRSFYSKKNQ